MLKSKANWKFSNGTDQNDSSNSMIDSLFQERGILTIEDKEHFLHPSLEKIQSPTNFHQIEKAKERIFKAIEQDEKMIVYGDYDADGVTSTAVLMSALMELGANCDYYIPNRFEEGYGLHEVAMKKLSNQGVSVIITVDTGIANTVEADFAKVLGMDLIITDHHEIQDEIPDAYAIIHPKTSPNYSFKQLAGVGVAFQFAHYLLDYMPTHLLDLVAIGTIADLVPLLGENRIFAYHGIKQLAKTENIGIQVLKKHCKLMDDVTERDIGFIIAPRLNAVGRIADANIAVDLLLTEDEEEAIQIAEYIEKLNTERQQIVNKIVKEAEQHVNDEDGIIILYDENWHEGVLGIAASRLVKRYDRPVMMLTYKKETDELKGSARSIPAFNLFDHCMAINDLFTNFGGHSQAAGMTFPLEHLEQIKTILNEKIFEQLSPDDFKQEIQISQSIAITQMTEELVQQINMFAPFGMKNEEPVFHLKKIPTQLRQIGQDKNHLKLQFKQKDIVVDAIGFRMGHLFYYISPNTEVSVVGKLQLNEWNGNKTVQILLDDIAVNEWQLFDYRGRRHDKNIVPYLSHFKNNTVVVNSNKQIDDVIGYEDVHIFTYESDVSTIRKSDILYLYDLPYDLDILRKIIQQANPSCIHVSYGVTEDAYLQTLPTRDDFKWLYGYLVKYSPIHLKVDLPKVVHMKKWTNERVVFILKVFLDLKFITVQDDVIYVNKNSEKTDLHQSRTYQLRLKQSNIEKTLYYSTYDELKQWLEQNVTFDRTNREELLHEL
ncbi:single-stranded-DNA-specific exonuclease RecJ [Pseudogracilibacillus auburnensis]|uniref:Single-stranded-DNA-specific exonuclease RecJ n=1 Tax=Pseudogracilibacillus auburnensis TaxID=1494959 RepID=A0A2V3W080_9BACI|nr:single-stranded-DNA-specific exonuclease RecJ [Pseudogracilibacillus auburnensis]MBO1003419.1 single-stranded-DNA-specific exonuclease RecJ [Pseudogracilibacillus auburnensis]PXW86594.1 exonuclease RecJ [Pseudogracilibacillus auburnensis]